MIIHVPVGASQRQSHPLVERWTRRTVALLGTDGARPSSCITDSYIYLVFVYIYIRPIMNARASATRTWSPALRPRGGHCLHMSLPSGRVVEYRRRVALAGSLPQCAYQGSFMYYRCHIVDPAGDAALLAGRRGIPEAMRRRPRHGPVGGEVALRGGFRGPRPICRGN